MARQLAALGVLVALEHYTPGGASFATLARRYARREIARWRNAGTFWVPA